MNGSNRTRWIYISGGLLVVALLIRLAIAFFGASQLDGKEGGSTGPAALLMAVALSILLILGVFWVTTSRWRRLLKSVRGQNPLIPAYVTTVSPEILDAVETFGFDRGLRVKTFRVVMLGEYECSWWSGLSKVSQVAAISSLEKIEYRVVQAPHLARTFEALQATIQTPTGPHSFSMFLMDDQKSGLVPRLASGAALQDIAARLGGTASSSGGIPVVNWAQRRVQQVPVFRDVMQGIAFAALAVFGVFNSRSVFVEADGDWAVLVGGGGRGPALPMGVMFPLWILIALMGVVAVVSCVVVVGRTIRARRIEKDQARGGGESN